MFNLKWWLLAGSGSRPGSALWVERGETRLLVDAGCAAADVPERPDGVVLTHAHHDHVRGLPEVLARFPGVRVFGTRETVALLRWVYKGQFSQVRADALCDIIQVRKFRAKFEVGEVGVEFRRAGHLQGAAMVALEAGRGRLLFSGDFCGHALEGVADAADFEGWAGGDLVLEGSIAHLKGLDGWEPEALRAGMEGPGLYVAGALGEAQVLAASGDFDVHVNLQGLVGAATYLSTTEALRALTLGRRVLIGGKELGARTASWELCAVLVGDKDASVTFVNRPARRSVGEELLGAPLRSKLRGFGGARKRCAVRSLALPMHATRPELLQTLEDCRPSRVTFFHNREDVLHAMVRAANQRGHQALVALPGVPFWMGDPG